MKVSEFQRLIEKTYFKRDSSRGLAGTFMWFTEEVGELATALREGTKQDLEEEFADVFAWLCSLASIAGVEMEEVVVKYTSGCPGCGKMPCECVDEKA
ncbi:MAG: nucleotide pyrophosphohydrolase [Planctomycetes bacterium]|nr:nucleotide pyrophosphohydrolase [Planctomycetota bacterium]